jgi:hypothetical protein
MSLVPQCRHAAFMSLLRFMGASCNQASRSIPFPSSSAEMDGAQPVFAELGGSVRNLQLFRS